MKKTLPATCALALSFLQILTSLAQSDTMIVYDVVTKQIKTIPPVLFDPEINFEQTSFSHGSLDGTTYLPLSLPTSNVINGTQFSDLVPAAKVFNLTDYPIRTAIKMMRYEYGTLKNNCSGTLVGQNFVLTAAHCLLGRGTKDWSSDSILVAPAYNNGSFQPGLETSMVKKYYIFKDFYEGTEFTDIALLELEKPIGKEIGWMGIGFHVDDSFFANNTFHKLSYPGTVHPYDTTKKYNGDTLYYDYGKITHVRNGIGVINHYGGVPGQSGSSFFHTDNANYYSVGVAVWSADYWHQTIDQKIFYQFKNIINGNIAATAQENQFENKFAIYPNPTKGLISIKANSGTADEYILSISDLQGREHYFKSVSFDNIISINLPELYNGTYLLTLKSKDGMFVEKLVLQR